jgi:hypothetical protein
MKNRQQWQTHQSIQQSQHPYVPVILISGEKTSQKKKSKETEG